MFCVCRDMSISFNKVSIFHNLNSSLQHPTNAFHLGYCRAVEQNRFLFLETGLFGTLTSTKIQQIIL